jgi:hypothetical protein
MLALGLGGTATSTALGAADHRCKRGSMHTIYKGQHRCLDLALRKLIYRELVHWQDTHPGQDFRAYVVIGRRFLVPVNAAYKIAAGGSAKIWPLPKCSRP